MEILKQFFIYAKDHFKTDIIVIVILLILYIIVQVTMKIIDRNLSLKYKEWKSFFYKSTSRYLKVFFGMLIVWIILMTLEASKLSHHGRGLIYKLVTIIILIMVTLIILKMIGQFKRLLIVRLENADQTVTYDKSDIYTLFYFINVVIWLGVFFVILSVLKVSPASLATFGGAGAIALSFIFKNSLENIVGGVFLHLDRPFVVGESIYTIDNKIEGTVEKIGWRLTVIRQFDQRPVYVPNATFVTSAVVNISRMTNRRIKQYVGIRY
ncbi:MAG: mechanosensitive ion channel, partial [Fusobacteria bacterium]|nr:mechanosensitive ion channel [Fusobacteriota bacterium]